MRCNPAMMRCDWLAAGPGQDSLGWLKAKFLCGDCKSLPLFLHRCCELSRPPRVGNLARHTKLFAEIRLLHYGAHVGGDMFSQCCRHAVWPEETNWSIEGKLWKSCLGDGWHLGMSWRPNAVRRREHFYLSCLKLRTKRGQRCFGHLDPARGNVVGRLLRVAVRDARHVKIVLLEEACEEKIDGAGCACPIKLSRVRARHGNQISHRFNVHRRRNGNNDDCVPTAGDREKVAIVIRHLLKHVGMGG